MSLGADAHSQVLDLLVKTMKPENWVSLVVSREQNFEADSTLYPPLHFAAEKGHVAITRALLRAGANRGLRYGSEQMSPLDTAAHQGHVEVVRLLIEHDGGVDVNATGATGFSPLHFAASTGKAETVQLLLLHGADRNALDGTGHAPVSLAAMKGHVAVTQALLSGCSRSDVNRRYRPADVSLLDWAASRGHVDVLKTIVEFGGGGVVDVNAQTSNGRTALHLASLGDNSDVVDVLVEAGARVEARHASMDTPLHYAACTLSGDVTAALLRHGADVNAQNRSHLTPLYRAAGRAGTDGSAEVVDILLRSGADETIADMEGFTPQDFAESKLEDEQIFGVGESEAELERVLMLLMNAPADRAWRRRRFLVLCRAFPDRVQLSQQGITTATTTSRGGSGNSVSNNSRLCVARTAPMTRRRAKLVKLAQAEADWARLSDMLLTGWGEEAIFRMIVGYL
ncbi:unnamed protein product [Pylaiella littoralis]